MRERCVALLASLLVISLSATTPCPAIAGQTNPHVNVTISVDPTPRLEKDDAVIMQAASTALNEQGYAALTTHVEDLKRAAKDTPAAYPAMERRGDGWLIRVDDRDEAVVMGQAIGEIEGKSGRTEARVSAVVNVYPTIFRLLGSDAVERHAYGEALGYLDKGLTLQPNNVLLVSEKAVALSGLGRTSEALALIDAALASDDPLVRARPALLLRRRGFALVELGRLDEARQAYETSLVTDPCNQTARSELTYIADLQRGKAPSEMQMTSSPRSSGDGCLAFPVTPP